MWAKLKDKLLTKLFIDWVKNEWDIDMLIQTRILIQQREGQLKRMVDTANKIEIQGFKRTIIN